MSHIDRSFVTPDKIPVQSTPMLLNIEYRCMVSPFSFIFTFLQR